MNLQNKVAIVTGASRGIGQAIALELAKKACRLVLVAQKQENLKETEKKIREHQSESICLGIDLSKPNLSLKIVDACIERFSQIDILVHCAGIFFRENLSQSCDLEEWDRLIDINYRAIYYLNKYALPHILKQEESAILSISSIAGQMTFPQGGAYCASKHALKAYSQCLFEDVREKNVKVCTLYPGLVNTQMGMLAGQTADPEKMIQVEDVASAALWALQSPSTVCPTEIVLRPQRSAYL